MLAPRGAPSYEEKESAKVRAAVAAKRDAIRGREKPKEAVTPADSDTLLAALNTLPPEQRQALLARLTRGE